MSAEGVEIAYQQMSEAEIGFHFLPIFCNFTTINRDSQLKSKHNLHNIFNQIYKLLYIR